MFLSFSRTSYTFSFGSTKPTMIAKKSRPEAMLGADILIVIPSLKEEAHIESVIASLQSDRRCGKALIVVSDGGSSDHTVAIVKRIVKADARVRMLTTIRHLSISASINRAVNGFGCERKWIVRVDAHAEYPKDYASRLVAKAVETGANSVVTPKFTWR
jgi:glycosyltransferase involved in cell wall biosynthesis